MEFQVGNNAHNEPMVMTYNAQRTKKSDEMVHCSLVLPAKIGLNLNLKPFFIIKLSLTGRINMEEQTTLIRGEIDGHLVTSRKGIRDTGREVWEVHVKIRGSLFFFFLCFS